MILFIDDIALSIVIIMYVKPAIQIYIHLRRQRIDNIINYIDYPMIPPVTMELSA